MYIMTLMHWGLDKLLVHFSDDICKVKLVFWVKYYCSLFLSSSITIKSVANLVLTGPQNTLHWNQWKWNIFIRENAFKMSSDVHIKGFTNKEQTTVSLFQPVS